MTSTITQIPGTPDPWWEAGALSAIETLAAQGSDFTAADLEALGVGQPDHPCRWGSVFAKAKSLKLIRKVGYAPSPRRSRDGGVCAVWRGASA